MSTIYWFDHLFDASNRNRNRSNATIESVQEWAKKEDELFNSPQSFRESYLKAVNNRWSMEKVYRILRIKK